MKNTGLLYFKNDLFINIPPPGENVGPRGPHVDRNMFTYLDIKHVSPILNVSTITFHALLIYTIKRVKLFSRTPIFLKGQSYYSITEPLRSIHTLTCQGQDSSELIASQTTNHKSVWLLKIDMYLQEYDDFLYSFLQQNSHIISFIFQSS